MYLLVLIVALGAVFVVSAGTGVAVVATLDPRSRTYIKDTFSRICDTALTTAVTIFTVGLLLLIASSDTSFLESLPLGMGIVHIAAILVATLIGGAIWGVKGQLKLLDAAKRPAGCHGCRGCGANGKPSGN